MSFFNFRRQFPEFLVCGNLFADLVIPHGYCYSRHFKMFAKFFPRYSAKIQIQQHARSWHILSVWSNCREHCCGLLGLLRSMGTHFFYQLDLYLLNGNQSFPLVWNQVIDLLMQMSYFKLRFQVDLIIMCGSKTVFCLLSILAHHDDRSLNWS